MERLVALLDAKQEAPRPIAMIPASEMAENTAWNLAQALRSEGMYVELGYRGNLGKRMKRANKLHARWAVILGEEEMAAAKVILKDLDSGEQRDIAQTELVNQMKTLCG